MPPKQLVGKAQNFLLLLNFAAMFLLTGSNIKALESLSQTSESVESAKHWGVGKKTF